MNHETSSLAQQAFQLHQNAKRSMPIRKHSTKRQLFPLAILIIISILAIINVFRAKDTTTLNVHDDIKQKRTAKPIMYTFMTSNKNDGELIKSWEDSWQEFGWDTKVLNMTDAKRHPDYELFDSMLTKHNKNEYDRACFYRWLAMATKNGGWYSSYDVFPLSLSGELGRELEKQSGFKSWALHVPLLIHGDKESYDKLVKLMGQVLSKEKPVDGHLSDMTVLLHLHKTHADALGVTTWKNQVYLDGYPYIKRGNVTEIDCAAVRSFYSTHLSPKATKEARERGIYPFKGSDFMKKRGEAAEIMFRDIRESNCHNGTIKDAESIAQMDNNESHDMPTEHKRSNETHTVKPVMYTYFEQLGPNGCCGMSRNAHNQLVQSWKDSWQSFGWDTKILNMTDAKHHPDYERFESMLTRHNVLGYDQNCFYRWLAMAMLEDGGWHSDYDNIPLSLTGELGRELEKQSGFKSWARHVPALIHADKDSYDKLVKLMGEVLSKEKPVEHDVLSDMYVLLDIHKTQADALGVTVWKNQVYGVGYPYVRKDNVTKIDCAAVKSYYSAHLAHKNSKDAWSEGTYPHIGDMDKDEVFERRGEAAAIITKDVRENCS